MTDATPPEEEMESGFISVLKKVADYRDISRPSIAEATVAVTEKYARSKLGIKKDEPLVFRGGFHCPKGWRLWKDFVNERDIGQVGRGCD